MTHASPSTCGSRTRELLRAALGARTHESASSDIGTAASVLVALFEQEGEPFLWLVRRTTTLRRHGGQVALPGGKTDPTDASALATALREAYEEIGLEPARVDVLGRLDDEVTSTGFTIAPFVGWLAEPFTPVPNPAEVACAFAVPLRVFREAPSGIPPLRGYSANGEWIWGATASIARTLAALPWDDARRTY
jgi:8-oxo-dGTP pyrophosphatase MutT (NUDIX family)